MLYNYQISNGELIQIPILPKRDSSGKFIKGIIPWNKGLKGIDIGGKETQFKKGNLPLNTKIDGYVSKRWHKKDKKYYLYIRVSKGKWELLHRFIWSQKNGEIPKGHLIAFKDGNSENYNIDNLEMITRAENVRRNHNIKKASETLKQLWKIEKIRDKYGLERKTKLRI